MPGLTYSLNIVARCTQMQRGQKLKELGIGGGQVPYLLRLNRFPGITQEELAKMLYVNKSTAARQLASLEKSGLVERRPSETDRRCLKLYLTDKGRDALPEVRKVIGEWNEYLLEGLSEEERASLLDMMARLSGRAQEYIDREEWT